MTAANFLWLLRDFVPEYYHANFGRNWTTKKGETMWPPAYMVPKDPGLNRVNKQLNLVTELGMLGAGFITFHKLF